VALAGVLAMEPRVLLIDEVMGNLDPWMQWQLLEILRQLAEGGKTVVVATHDMQIARYWADLVAVMEAGRVMAADTPTSVFDDPYLRICCARLSRGRRSLPRAAGARGPLRQKRSGDRRKVPGGGMPG